MPPLLPFNASRSLSRETSHLPQRAAHLRRPLGSAPMTGSFEQQLLQQYAQGQLTMAQVEAEIEQLTTDWECVYTG